MKKVWIVSSVAIITIVFIYTMFLISSRNTCTWVRIYECTALQKQQAANQQAAISAQLTQQQLSAQQAAAKLAQQEAANQQAAAAQLAQQQAAAQQQQLQVNTRTRAS